MRLCFLVDYRSPIARNWIAYFVDAGHDVHIVSTHPGGEPQPGVAGVSVHTLGFSGLTGNATVHGLLSARSTQATKTSGGSLTRALRRAGPHINGVAMRMLMWTTPLEARARAWAVARHLDRLRPDLVHAMRIPFEGILAAEALRHSDIPLVTSIWGNDLTLWAPKNPIIGRATRRALERTTALHTDCVRDQRLAASWGWNPRRPAAVLPGSGGIQMDLFRAGAASAEVRARWNIDAGRPVIVNPRSFRPGYVRNDTFFNAIPRVLARRGDAIFVGVGMAGHPYAEEWRRRAGVGASIRLLPSVPRAEMAELFRLATITVSPSMHDGTPNTLLEAMSCGAFPVAGDIESVREWITDGENGLLCDPADPDALADALLHALDDEALRARAAATNRALVTERAEYGSVMRAAEAFYERVAALRVPRHASAGRTARAPIPTH